MSWEESNINHPKPRVFISYARSDGETFASKLREHLNREEPEITLWQDRSEMEGGVGWWRQITRALDAVQFLVLIMTPTAIASPMVQREWRYARQQGVCIYPVLGLPSDEIDFSHLPRWMRRIHCFNLDKEWQTFVGYLKSPCRASRAAFMAPDLPEAFVPRPDTFQPVLDALVSNSGQPVALTTSLQGAGGLGKTTLAIALCHSDQVVEAFDDGVLWVTLGKEPKLLEAVSKLYRALTGQKPDFVDLEEAEYRFSNALEDKSCLLVIDDAWQASDLKPFLRGGKGCARLITSRITDVARGTTAFPVDAMSLTEAVTLLQRRLPSSQVDKQRFQSLARRLGEWPLLLELANAQLRRRIEKGDTLGGAFDYLQQKLQHQGIVAFDVRRATDRQEAISRSIELSLELLDENEQAAFIRIALFPEDVDIPLEIVQVLWNLDSFAATELAELLDDMSLARFSAQSASLRLHDVIRAYLETRLEAGQDQHGSLADLLDTPSLRETEYAWRWLPYHLVQAGRHHELRRRLLDINWLGAKLRTTSVSAVVEDFEYLAEEQDMQRLQEAIKLANPVISNDPDQLPSQLAARLIPVEDETGKVLRDLLGNWHGAPWLEPFEALLTLAGGPMIATLVGHEGPVLDIALTKDGALAVSGSADGTLCVWDWRRGCVKQIYRGHNDWVYAVDTNGDGSLLASASADKSVRLWEGETGRCYGVLNFTDSPPNCLVFARDGSDRCIVSAGERIAELHPKALQLEWRKKRHCGEIRAVAALPDGDIVTGGDDRMVALWHQAEEEAASPQKLHLGPIRDLACAQDVPVCVSVGADGLLQSWSAGSPSAKSSHRISDIVFHSHAVAISATAKRVVTGDEDGVVTLWNRETTQIEARLEGHSGAVNGIVLSPDGQYALSASDDRTIRVWDLQRPPLPGRPLPALGSRGGTLCTTPDGNYLLTLSGQDRLSLWEMSSGTACGEASGPGSWILQVPDGPQYGVLLLSGNQLYCRRMDASDCRMIRRGDDLRALYLPLSGGRRLLVDREGGISVWDIPMKSSLLRLSLHPDQVRLVTLTTSGNHLALLRPSGLLEVWEMAQAQRLIRIEASPIMIALSQSGSHLALAFEDGTIRLMDQEGRQSDLGSHQQRVNSLIFSQDGRQLISAGEDQTVQVWETSSGNRIAAYTGEHPMRCCAINSDNNVLAAEDGQGQLHFLHLRFPKTAAAEQVKRERPS